MRMKRRAKQIGGLVDRSRCLSIRHRIRLTLPALAVLAAIVLLPGNGHSSWRIDGARFLESVHADNTCLDCHGDIAESERHPNPSNLERDAASFFSDDKCLDCHDEVQAQMDAGEHGGETKADPEVLADCIGCHDPHYEGAPDAVTPAAELRFAEDDKDCLICHLGPTGDETAAIGRVQTLCFACHAAGVDDPGAARLIDSKAYSGTPHAKMDCLACHLNADGYPHRRQRLGDCLRCHYHHEESVAHDAHLTVSCEACHLEDVTPYTVSATGTVAARSKTAPGEVSAIHAMKPFTEERCARCHFEGTPIGAAAMVLPAKSILCMGCHAATLGVGDAVTVIALVIFGLGLLLFSPIWLGGVVKGAVGDGTLSKLAVLVRSGLAAVCSPRIITIARALLFDVLLQRRLYRRSPRRWAIHSLIFLPFVVRFVWGLAALFASNWLKQWEVAFVLVDKNHPVTAFLFDATGLSIFVGIVLAYVRGSQTGCTRTPGLPSQDRLALGLIGGIVAVGFILEAMRIALTGVGPLAAWAFIGYPMSQLFADMTGLSRVYGYVWYLHAILTGAFIAYLPFSRLMHIIMAPVVLIMNAVAGERHISTDASTKSMETGK